MDEDDEGFEMYEDFNIIEIHIEFMFEEWPQLAAMEAKAREDLCTAIREALEAAECPVHAIKAKSDTLHVLLKLNPNLSTDDVADIVENTAQCITGASGEAHSFDAYSAEGLGPSDVIEAVMRLR